MIKSSPASKGPAVSIAVVMPAFNRKEMAADNLDALLAQSRPPQAVYVIDNASSDGTHEYFAEKGLADPPTSQTDPAKPFVSRRLLDGSQAKVELIYVRMPENIGCPGGYGEGMRRAMDDGHDWLWLLDDDSIPEPDALEMLARHLEPAEDPEVKGAAMLASIIRDQFGTLKKTHRSTVNRDKLYPGFTIALPDKAYEPGQLTRFHLGAWAGLMVRAEAAKKIAPPNADLFFGYCDLEYSLRLAQTGKFLLETDSKVVHHFKMTEDERRTGHFLGKSHTYPRIENLSRDYFFKRNRIYVARLYSTRKPRFYYTAIKLYFSSAKKILLYQDHKLKRLKALTNLTLDGLTGNLDNKKPRRLS